MDIIIFDSQLAPTNLLLPTCSLIALEVNLLCLASSEADRSLAEIVDGIPLSEESITQDCEWSYGLWEVLKGIC